MRRPAGLITPTTMPTPWCWTSMRSASSLLISASDGSVQDVGSAAAGALAGAGQGDAAPAARRLSVIGSFEPCWVKTPESVWSWSERSPSTAAPTTFISIRTWSPWRLTDETGPP